MNILRWWNILCIDWIWYEMLMKWYCYVMWCMVDISFYLLIESPAHPLAFFSRFWAFWSKSKDTCIAIEVLRLGPMKHKHPIAFFEVVHVANWCLMMLWKHYYICLVYVMKMWCIFWFISGICIGIWNCIFVKMFWKKYMVLSWIWSVWNWGFNLSLKCSLDQVLANQVWMIFSLQIVSSRKTGECFLTTVI